MKRIKTTVSYKVSPGLTCDSCRFCVAVKRGQYTCVLHNMPLTTQGSVIYKSKECLRNLAYRSADVPDAQNVDVPYVIKWTIHTFMTEYKKLVNEHYPTELALDVAKKLVLNDKSL